MHHPTHEPSLKSRDTREISEMPSKGDSDAVESGSISPGGVTVQTLKPFTTLSALGIGYGTTNTAVGLLLVLGSTLPMGGSPLFFWGFLVMAVVGLATATTLAELASAMPHPGGQYIWVNRLSPPRYRRFLSYTIAVVSWLAAVATGASACLSVPTGVCAIISLLNPNFVYKRWMGFVGFQLLNILTVICASFEHALPRISKIMLLFSCMTIGVIFITLFAMSDSHASAKDYFTTSVNISGWPKGIAFIIGMNGANWSFSCLDVATHLAEEMPSPSTDIPKALIWTIIVGFGSGLLVVTSVLINIPTIDGAADNSALSLFYMITKSKAAAVGLWIPVLITTAGAVWSIQTWQSRLAWTISREGGFPLHRHLSKLAPAPLHTPVWSLIWSASGTALFGCLYLGSDLAFNSLISTGLLLQYISYSVPVVLVLLQGRSNFQHGPFWYPKLGLIANVVMLSWTIVALIFYCFPYYTPVVAVQMNYASPVLHSVKPPHSKSRNGCLRCKARKCDERKPACSRCEDQKYQCPGYALNVRWSQKHQTRPSTGESPLRQRRAKTRTNVAPNSVTEGLNQINEWLDPSPQLDFLMPADLFNMDSISQDLLSNEISTRLNDNIQDSPGNNFTIWTLPEDSGSTFDNDERMLVLDQLSDNTTGHSFFHSQSPTQEQALIQARHACPDPHQRMSNTPTTLSEYFFREVITLYCSWDSDLNVMRNIIEKMWQSSGVLYHTIQSMAATCLSKDFPHLLPIARQERSQALQLVNDRPQEVGKQVILLASMLLGHTSSWLNPHNLATETFRASQSILDEITTENGDTSDISFFKDTMDYWAMLLVYLTDKNELGQYRREASIGPPNITKPIEPHPYSGISQDMVRALTDTGILIFQYRKHMSTMKFMTESDLDVFRAALREGRRLERIFLAHQVPSTLETKNPGDPKTPLKHLELMDEAYRCTGLLQLYRVFPDLLNERYAPWTKDHILRPLPAHQLPTKQERQLWLTKFALHILGILEEIPFESRTRSAQPFVMVSISGELRQTSQHLQGSQVCATDPGMLSIDDVSIEVARARKFVSSRLSAYTHILPLRKSQVILELINQVWSAIDDGQEDAYWLDIAYEKKLGTMMG
ncbi:choline transporter [Fusarium beomiforme]|uniref:Choline transporter n=1 Tax=Fusarium beomiforme TaxID=44412 RepID=A0A9P5AA28_9HYPO|nr:choline transporter [Fusarium beomiforme]